MRRGASLPAGAVLELLCNESLPPNLEGGEGDRERDFRLFKELKFRLLDKRSGDGDLDLLLLLFSIGDRLTERSSIERRNESFVSPLFLLTSSSLL